MHRKNVRRAPAAASTKIEQPMPPKRKDPKRSKSGGGGDGGDGSRCTSIRNPRGPSTCSSSSAVWTPATWLSELRRLERMERQEHPIVLSLDPQIRLQSVAPDGLALPKSFAPAKSLGAKKTVGAESKGDVVTSSSPALVPCEATVRVACVVRPLPRLRHINAAFREASKQLKQEAHRGVDDLLSPSIYGSTRLSNGSISLDASMSQAQDVQSNSGSLSAWSADWETQYSHTAKRQSWRQMRSPSFASDRSLSMSHPFGDRTAKAASVIYSCASTLSLWSVDNVGGSRSGQGATQGRDSIIVREAATGVPLLHVHGAKPGVPITALVHAPYRSLLARETGQRIPVRSIKDVAQLEEEVLLDTDFVWVGFRDGSIRLIAANHEQLRSDWVSGSANVDGDAMVVFELLKFHSSSIVSLATSPCNRKLSGSNVTTSTRLSTAFDELTAACPPSRRGSRHTREDRREHLSLLCSASLDSCIAVWDVRVVCQAIEARREEHRVAVSSLDYGRHERLRDLTKLQFHTEPRVTIKSTCSFIDVRPLLRLKGSVGGLRVLQWLSTLVTTEGYKKQRDAVARTRDPHDVSAADVLSRRRFLQKATRHDVRNEHKLMLKLTEAEMKEVEDELLATLPRLCPEPRQSRRVNFIVAGDEHGAVHLWDLDEELGRKRGPLPDSCAPSRSASPASSHASPQEGLKRDERTRSSHHGAPHRGPSIASAGGSRSGTSVSRGFAPNAKIFRKGSLGAASVSSLSWEAGDSVSSRAGSGAPDSFTKFVSASTHAKQHVGGPARWSGKGTAATSPVVTTKGLKKKTAGTTGGSKSPGGSKGAGAKGSKVTASKSGGGAASRPDAVKGRSAKKASAALLPQAYSSTLSANHTTKEWLEAVSTQQEWQGLDQQPWESVGSSPRLVSAPGREQENNTTGGPMQHLPDPTKSSNARNHASVTPAVKGAARTTAIKARDAAGKTVGTAGTRKLENRPKPSASTSVRAGAREEQSQAAASQQRHCKANDYYARTTTKKIQFTGGVGINGITFDLPPRIVVTLRRVPDHVERMVSVLQPPTDEEIALRHLENDFDDLTDEVAVYHAYKNLQFFLGVEGTVIHLKCMPTNPLAVCDSVLERLKSKSTSGGMTTPHSVSSATSKAPELGGCFTYNSFNVYFYRQTLESHTQPVTALMMDTLRKQLWVARNDGLLSIFSTETMQVITRVAHPSALGPLGPPPINQWRREQRAYAESTGLPLHLDVHPESAAFTPDRFHDFVPLMTTTGYRLFCATIPLFELGAPTYGGWGGGSRTGSVESCTSLHSTVFSALRLPRAVSQTYTVTWLDGSAEFVQWVSGRLESWATDVYAVLRSYHADLAAARRVARLNLMTSQNSKVKVARVSAIYFNDLYVHSLRYRTFRTWVTFLVFQIRNRLSHVFQRDGKSLISRPPLPFTERQLQQRLRSPLSPSGRKRACKQLKAISACRHVSSSTATFLMRVYWRKWMEVYLVNQRPELHIARRAISGSLRSSVYRAVNIGAYTRLAGVPIIRAYWRKWVRAAKERCVALHPKAPAAEAGRTSRPRAGPRSKSSDAWVSTSHSESRGASASTAEVQPAGHGSDSGQADDESVCRSSLITIITKIMLTKAGLFAVPSVVPSEAVAVGEPGEGGSAVASALSAPAEDAGVDEEWYQLLQAVLYQVEGRSRSAVGASVMKLAFLPLLEATILAMRDVSTFLHKQEARSGGAVVKVSGRSRSLLQGCVLSLDCIVAHSGEVSILYPEDMEASGADGQSQHANSRSVSPGRECSEEVGEVLHDGGGNGDSPSHNAELPERGGKKKKKKRSAADAKADSVVVRVAKDAECRAMVRRIMENEAVLDELLRRCAL